MNNMSNKIYKISFDLLESDFNILESLAEKRNIAKADIIRQALSYFKFIEEARKKGSSILVEDNKKQLRKVVFK